MAGIQTLSSTVSAPIVQTYILDDANATTGLLMNVRNDSGLDCLVKVGLYFKTQAASGQEYDLNVTTTSGAQGTSITDGGTATTGTIVWSDGNDVVADGSYITLYNSSSGTATVATSLVGYAVVLLFPLCAL